MPICDPVAREQFRRGATKGRRASVDSSLNSAYHHPGYHHPYGSSLPPPSVLNHHSRAAIAAQGCLNTASAARAGKSSHVTSSSRVNHTTSATRRPSLAASQWLTNLTSKFNTTPPTSLRQRLQKQSTLPAVLESPPLNQNNSETDSRLDTTHSTNYGGGTDDKDIVQVNASLEKAPKSDAIDNDKSHLAHANSEHPLIPPQTGARIRSCSNTENSTGSDYINDTATQLRYATAS